MIIYKYLKRSPLDNKQYYISDITGSA